MSIITVLKTKYENSILQSIIGIIMFVFTISFFIFWIYYGVRVTMHYDEIPNEKYNILSDILKDNENVYEIATILNYYKDKKIYLSEYRSILSGLNYMKKDKNIFFMIGEYDDENNDFKNEFELLINKSIDIFYNSEIKLEHYNEIAGLTVLSKDNLQVAKEYLSDGYISISEFNNFPEINKKINYYYIRYSKNTKDNEEELLEIKNRYINNILLTSK